MKANSASLVVRTPLDDGLQRPRNKRRPKKHKPENLLGWAVFLLLLLAGALVCWFGSFYIFGHPEEPHSYAILRKLKKLEPLKRFEPTAAPPGRFYTVEKAWKLYSELPEAKLAALNNDLLRAYLENYRDKTFLIPYLTGRFNVMQARPLARGDVFTSGYVALARSLENPQMLLEYVYPATPEYQEDLARMLITGVDLQLERTFDLSVILHIARLPGGRLQFTVMPLNYDSYGMGDARPVQLSPPETLNLAATLPLLKAGQLEESQKHYAVYTTATRPGVDARGKATPASTPLLIARAGPTPDQSVTRIARALPLHGEAVPIPSATPPLKKLPVNPVVQAASPAPTDVVVQAARPSPTPLATLATLASATPPPVVVVEATPSPTPKPVIVSAAAQTPAPAARWQTYLAGRMPRGKLVETPDLEHLARTGVEGTTYLQGDFVVTATKGSQAVLRPTTALASALGLGRATAGQTRIIVEFPEGTTAPREGSVLNRNGARPFQLTSVRRAANGQLNVYAREVTTP